MSEDIFNISAESAAKAAQAEAEKEKSNQHKIDPTLWRPLISNKVDNYQAKIRLLPQGMNGVKNNELPSVTYMMHYLKAPAQKVFKNVICKKTITGEKGDCPICNAIWDQYNEAKKHTNNPKDDPACKLQISRLSNKRHVANILIVEDRNNPDLNGRVMKWDHTDHINSVLLKPYYNTIKIEDDNQDKGFMKKEEKFNPYSPKNGRNRIVIVVPDPKKKGNNGNNPMPNYDGSFWDDAPTDIAGTDEGIIQILDQCHDLSKYRDVPDDATLMKEYTDFLTQVNSKQVNSVATGSNQGNANGFVGNDAAPSKSQTPNQANATEYLAGGNGSTTAQTSTPVQDDPFVMGAPASNTGNIAPIDDNADEELPF